MKYKVTFLAWRKGKKWRLVWHSGGERSERYFNTKEEAQAYADQLNQDADHSKPRFI